MYSLNLQGELYQSFIVHQWLSYSWYYLLKSCSSTLVALFSHWIQMFCTFNKNLWFVDIIRIAEYHSRGVKVPRLVLWGWRQFAKHNLKNLEEGVGFKDLRRCPTNIRWYQLISYQSATYGLLPFSPQFADKICAAVAVMETWLTKSFIFCCSLMPFGGS